MRSDMSQYMGVTAYIIANSLLLFSQVIIRPWIVVIIHGSHVLLYVIIWLWYIIEVIEHWTEVIVHGTEVISHGMEVIVYGMEVMVHGMEVIVHCVWRLVLPAPIEFSS